MKKSPWPTEFIEGSKFQGVMLPRFYSRPDGPKMQSFSACVCGRRWNMHRFVDGACPVKDS